MLHAHIPTNANANATLRSVLFWDFLLTSPSCLAYWPFVIHPSNLTSLLTIDSQQSCHASVPILPIFVFPPHHYHPPFTTYTYIHNTYRRWSVSGNSHLSSPISLMKKTLRLTHLPSTEESEGNFFLYPEHEYLFKKEKKNRKKTPWAAEVRYLFFLFRWLCHLPFCPRRRSFAERKESQKDRRWLSTFRLTTTISIHREKTFWLKFLFRVVWRLYEISSGMSLNVLSLMTLIQHQHTQTQKSKESIQSQFPLSPFPNGFK